MANPLNRGLRSALVIGAGVMVSGAGNALTVRVIESTDRKTPIVGSAAVANTDLDVPAIGLESLIELVNPAYLAAGADFLFIEAPLSRKGPEAIPREDRQKLVAQNNLSNLAARYGTRPASVRP
jgi:hypothetical protein